MCSKLSLGGRLDNLRRPKTPMYVPLDDSLVNIVVHALSHQDLTRSTKIYNFCITDTAILTRDQLITHATQARQLGGGQRSPALHASRPWVSDSEKLIRKFNGKAIDIHDIGIHDTSIYTIYPGKRSSRSSSPMGEISRSPRGSPASPTSCSKPRARNFSRIAIAIGRYQKRRHVQNIVIVIPIAIARALPPAQTTIAGLCGKTHHPSERRACRQESCTCPPSTSASPPRSASSAAGPPGPTLDIQTLNPGSGEASYKNSTVIDRSTPWTMIQSL